MNALDQLMKLQRFTLDEKRRQAVDFENLIAKLSNDAQRLEAMMQQEIEKAKTAPDLQRTLPAFRKMVEERRHRLLASIAGLRLELGALREQMGEHFAELKKTETVLKQRAEKLRQMQMRRENARSDEASARRLRFRTNISVAG